MPQAPASQTSYSSFRLSARRSTAASLDASLPPRTLLQPRKINLLVPDLQDRRLSYYSANLARRANARARHGSEMQVGEEEGDEAEMVRSSGCRSGMIPSRMIRTCCRCGAGCIGVGGSGRRKRGVLRRKLFSCKSDSEKR
jgi:hypothetical protein